MCEDTILTNYQVQLDINCDNKKTYLVPLISHELRPCDKGY